MRKLVLKESAALDEKQMNKVMGGDGGTAKNDSITNSSDANKSIIDGGTDLLPGIGQIKSIYGGIKKMYNGINYYSKKVIGYYWDRDMQPALEETHARNERETVDGGMLPEVTITAQRKR